MDSLVPNLSGLVVLLVETKNEIAEVIVQYLQSAKMVVVRVTSIQIASERLSFMAPHIVIANLQLCQENGFILLNRVREYERSLDRAEIPMIAIAEYSDKEGEIALEAGFQAYLRTPIEADRLYGTISQFFIR